MARRRRYAPPGELRHRWFLAEWASHFGKRQADAQRDLGWSKASASELWNGHQRYTQNLVDEASEWLGIRPYELLMSPFEALRLRRVQDAFNAVAEEDHAFERDGPDRRIGQQARAPPPAIPDDASVRRRL